MPRGAAHRDLRTGESVYRGDHAHRQVFRLEHRALFAAHEPATDLSSLLTAVDALDLWRKESPAFRGGLALDELFWEVVSSYVPVGHPWHDRFVSEILLAAAAAAMPFAVPSSVLIFLWGVASFALVPPLQVRVMAAASDAPNLASSVNIGAFNLGNAIGAALGGAVIAGGLGYPAVSLAGAAAAGLGLVLVLVLARRRAPATVPAAG